MISPMQAMMPPSPPDLSMAALQAAMRSISANGRQLGVPPPPRPQPQQYSHRIDLKA
jgi:hypothetical protein